MNTIERRLCSNGEKETIAKYKDVDAYLKRLEKKLRESITLDVGLEGNDRVSGIASQHSSTLTHPNTQEKAKMRCVELPSASCTGSVEVTAEDHMDFDDKVRYFEAKLKGELRQQSLVRNDKKLMRTTTSSDLCFICGTRVYLVERLGADGMFFHQHCFKCHHCNAQLRLGNNIYAREGRYRGKFFCIPHGGLTVQAGQSRGPALTAELTKAPGGTKKSTAMETPTRSHRHELSKQSGAPVRGDMQERGTTPERVKFENSPVEQGSDEEDYISEEEWTARNFGAFANEQDDTSHDSEDDSDS